MGMDDHPFFLRLEVKRGRLAFEQLSDEFFEEETPRCHGFRAGQLQLAVIPGEHRITSRLEKNNRRGAVQGGEDRKVVAAEFFRLIQISRAERRTPAAFSLRCE